MPAWAIPAAISAVGAVAGYMGSKGQNEANVEAAEAARDLPEWLKPFYIGGGPYPDQEPVPVNYNWLDAMNGVAQSGMPSSSIPPMNMNNPMMTFQNVHTPTEGGPWGYGLSPGQLTTEAGIPSASAGPPPTRIPLGPQMGGMGGPQMGGVGPGAGQGAGQGPAFVPAPPGFTPGPQTQGPPAGGGGDLMTPEVLALAKQYQQAVSGARTRHHWAGGDDRPRRARSFSPLDALQWAQSRSGGVSEREMFDAANRRSMY